MLCEIITIGDEILIGQIVDTNSAWMAKELNKAGILVKQITSVSDNKQHIIKALDEAKSRADIILITGGLGPTKDDITKATLCEYFNTTLARNWDAYRLIKTIFDARALPVTPTNEKQADLPINCTPIMNSKGTAPGMWFDEDGKVFVSMPGVPYEMMAIMSEFVIPKLKEKFELPFIIHQTILIQGIGESFLSDKIEKWELALPSNCKLAYLPSIGMLRLRISAVGKDKHMLQKQVQELVESLTPIISEYIYGFDDEPMEQIVGRLLKERGLKIATAESCTGGYIAHRLTSIPGSSSYFEGSVIAYSYDIKESMLDVPKELLQKYGAVSEQVTLAMVEGVKKRFKTDYAIAASGIAGPDGGTNEKPVGTVWIAISTPQKSFATRFQFGTDRERNIIRTSITALNLIRKEILAAK
ncbi:MAG: competence/damage-inducible protein A [Bacteroidota bacterium]